jgi:putative FmdB family regulatory protein
MWVVKVYQIDFHLAVLNIMGDLYTKGESFMPIYEFCCNECGQNFERLVFGAEKPECPACNSLKVNRLMSACGFISKGSGGETVSSSASGSACSGCAATSCSSCGH